MQERSSDLPSLSRVHEARQGLGIVIQLVVTHALARVIAPPLRLGLAAVPIQQVAEQPTSPCHVATRWPLKRHTCQQRRRKQRRCLYLGPLRLGWLPCTHGRPLHLPS